MIYKIISKIYKALAPNKLFYKLAVKFRNQLNIFIGFHFASTHNHLLNGEKWFVEAYNDKIKTFMDVGANKGDWTEMMFQICGEKNISKAYLFEPGTTAFNIIQNKFTNNSKIDCFKIALSNKEGLATFYEEDNAGETSSLVKNFSINSTKVTNVEVTTIDSFFEKNKISNIDLLKIDCEGFDFQVLLGASKTLREKKVKIIQFEYGDGWQLSGGTLLAAYSLLNSADYNVYALKENKLEKIKNVFPGDYFRYSNFIASINNLNEAI